MNTLYAIDLFSGAGGITQALKNSGFNVRLAIEMNPVFTKSYRLNHCRAEMGEKDYIIERNILEVTKEDIEDLASDLLGGQLDLLAGCPPCQGFSRQMVFKKKVMDPRNYLAFEYLRFVKMFRPKYIFLENVPGFGENKVIWPRLKESLQKKTDDGISYKLKFGRIDAADLGVPQRRNRFVLVGKRLDICKNTDLRDTSEVPFPELKYKDNHVTLEDYFKQFNLPKPLPLREAPNDQLHKYSHLGNLNLLRLQHTPPGKGRESWPEKVTVNGENIRLKLKCHDNNPGYRDVYGRMDWKSVAPTLTGGCLNISKGRFAYPTEDRPITAREAALIQTFPPDYKFAGTWTDIALQIGNAVPVKMGQAFFDEIVKDIQKARD
ncbi:DNA cytosine methyltransferase [Desulfitobacterium sp.]|uniref:DNA cytosine methyltransferase n=1 Tax=Desulfitobacterium sp. TaxID=49981 RepID=UPI002CE4250C|nr:DNA cytosine methyltransferase [Desulfitobacterium sp.]HVJ48460.1 DNA cytosine methyltransferase [Desulfitobacterium sp.]